MVDGIKFSFEIQDFQEWISKTKLDFKKRDSLPHDKVYSGFQSPNSECISRFTETYGCRYKGYLIERKHTIYGDRYGEVIDEKNRVSIRGSIHKNCNISNQIPKGQNFSRVTYGQVKKEILELCTILSLNPVEAKLRNLEFGLNVKTDFPVFEFLRKNLLTFRGKSFTTLRTSKPYSIGYQIQLYQYTLKIYDKSKQHGLNGNLMRFEIKFKKMEPLAKFGIRCLNDLFDLNKINDLFNLLVEKWLNILLYDDQIDIKKLGSLTGFYTQIGTPGYWETIYNAAPAKVGYLRRKLKEIINKFGCDYSKIFLEKLEAEYNSCIYDFDPLS